jgi:single-stranded-DNA-specific exonuclease
MLREKGVKVVITDHHLPGSELPQADALVNPCVSAPDGMSPLCGAAVAFVLAASLVEKARSRKLYSGGSIAGPMLVMAGLATVTDSMPLTGLNRVMVALAVHHFHCHAPLGLRKLYERSGKSAVVSSRDFGFALGPRINASGRLASGMDALELLLCDDEDIAAESARIIDLCNSDRKKIEQEMVEAALAKVVPGAAAQVIEIETDRPGAVGVIGIVASRVMERIAADDGLSGGRGEVPVCVITACRGSARSPDRINIRDAMESCSGVLERFGGHAAAAGFSVREGMVDEFRCQLDGYCSALEPEGVARPRAISARERVEAWLEADEVTLDLARWIVRMEPFGEGNAEPVFGLRSVGLSQVRPMGADGRHVQFNVADCNNIRAVWWNRSDRLDELRQKSFARFDLVFTILFSTYGGDHPELRVIDVLPAGGTVAAPVSPSSIIATVEKAVETVPSLIEKVEAFLADRKAKKAAKAAEEGDGEIAVTGQTAEAEPDAL